MALSKRCYKLKANSLLESVIALSIIAVCLYIAVVVYSRVFTPKTSLKAYSMQNKINEAFVYKELGIDTLAVPVSEDQSLKIDEQDVGSTIKVVVKNNGNTLEKEQTYYYIKP